ncbi:MAG: NusG domain II-containing protein [Clostridia bacterium]|nr:NusG domain II-containing protein [Clostridia bacterium]
MDKIKNRTWILIFTLLVAFLAAISFLKPKQPSSAVGIYQNGILLQTVDLSSDQTIVVEGEAGRNTIVVQNGEILVRSAECPDGVCVKHGPLSPGGTPIICLPNRLVIRWMQDAGTADAVSGRAY